MATKPINVHEAKTNFSKLLARVERGERIVIARGGVPVAELRPIEERIVKRVLGADRGRGWIADDFNAPMTEDDLLEPGG